MVKSYNESPLIFDGIDDFCQCYHPLGNKELHDRDNDAEAPCSYKVDNDGHVYQFESATKFDAFHPYNRPTVNKNNGGPNLCARKRVLHCQHQWQNLIYRRQLMPKTTSSLLCRIQGNYSVMNQCCRVSAIKNHQEIDTFFNISTSHVLIGGGVMGGGYWVEGIPALLQSY